MLDTDKEVFTPASVIARWVGLYSAKCNLIRRNYTIQPQYLQSKAHNITMYRMSIVHQVIKFARTWTWRSRCKISRQNISTHSVSQWQTEHKASHETVRIYESTLTFKHHWFRSIQPHVHIVGMRFRLPIVHFRHREQLWTIARHVAYGRLKWKRGIFLRHSMHINDFRGVMKDALFVNHSRSIWMAPAAMPAAILCSATSQISVHQLTTITTHYRLLRPSVRTVSVESHSVGTPFFRRRTAIIK